MGWMGALIGAFVGGRGGGGPLGAIIGAVIGHLLQGAAEKSAGAGNTERVRRTYSKRRAAGYDARERSAVFCTAAAAMLAKMAKADGRVSEAEIASVESSFRRLGFSAETRRMAVEAFRRAKDDGHSIYEYANDFAAVVRSMEVRELFYGMLWDLACVDGEVSEEEDLILRMITTYLGVPPAWYAIYARERFDAGSARRGGEGRRERGENRSRREAPARDALADAYATLGVSPSASDDEVKKAYREKAKRYHPDTLKAQGLPDEMIGKATEQMARVNAAWAEIRRARGI